jgi:predicted amidohydrolase YtcJ
MDLVLYNGQIYTMSDEEPQVEAIAIRGEMIVAVGPSDEILKLKHDKTQLIDLDGKTVIPGLNDSHLHLYSMGLYLNLVDLMEVTSIKEVKERVSHYLLDQQVPAKQWVRGRGWNQDYFTDEKRFITKADLDEISTEHPIILYRACGHLLVANSQAIEACGLNENTKPVFGGEFDLETGIFREKAIELIINQIPDPTITEIKETLVTAMQYANQQGLTSLQTDDLDHLPSRDFKKMLQAYHELQEEGKLTCRIYQQSLMPTLERLEAFLDLGYKTGVGDRYFKIGPLKLLSDGSLGARTAALRKPYHDDPSTKGILTYERDDLYRIIEFAHRSDMQVAVHCIGDGAMEQVLGIIEEVLEKYPRDNHRHGIIHCQIMDRDLMKRYNQSDVLAYVQPIFLHYDMHIVEKRVGHELAQTSYAFKSMMEEGISVSIGTDSPIEACDTMPNIHCAITRQDLKGQPEAGWNEAEKLSAYETIYGYTVNGAYASFEENIKGKIIPRYLADLTVLDQNIFTIDQKDILNTSIMMTIVGGKIVYQNH